MSATVIICPRSRLKSSLHLIRAVSLRCTNGLLVMASAARHVTNHRQGIGSRCMCLSRKRRRCLAQYVTVAWLLRASKSNYSRVLWYHRSSAYGSMATTAMSLCARPNIVYQPILTQHVELIQPTTAFLRTKGHRSEALPLFSTCSSLLPSHSADAKIAIPGSAQSVNASCNSTITVSCLKQLYNIVDYVPQATHQNAIAVTGYLGEFAHFADLRQFNADQVPDAANASFNVVLINGVSPPFVSLFREDDFRN